MLYRVYNMRSRFLRLTLLLMLTATACGLPSLGSTPTQPPVLETPSLIPTLTKAVLPPQASETPAQPTFTFTTEPSSTPEPTDTPGPTQTPTIVPFPATPTPLRIYPILMILPTTTQAPAPAALIPQPAGQISILLLGSDQRPKAVDFHTDVLMLLTIKPDGSASLFSFPRDLLVYIPGFRMGKINIAYPHGGFDLLATTLEYNFGIRPDHFVLVNFSGFKSVVDNLGGVDVNVATHFSDARDGYPDGFSVEKGITHMDGETALWYVRARMTTNDFDRLRRAQEVIVAIGQKLLSRQALTHIPNIYAAYRDSVTTNLTLEDLLGLQPLLEAVNQDRVQRYNIPYQDITQWWEPGTGYYYLIPKTEPIQQLLQQAMGIK